MTYRQRALEVARTQLGVRESPAGSNSGPRVNEYLRSAGLGPGYPWCMAFVNWCYRKAGLDINHPNEASVGFFEEWARRHGYLVTDPRPGDIVCYRFDADNWPDHVGIVESVGPTRIVAIEGNTAVGDDANGGMVMRRSRALRRLKFARIPGERPKRQILRRRVDVLVDGKLVLRRQNPANPAVLRRIARWIRSKDVIVRRAK